MTTKRETEIMAHEEAINALVERDVAKWGEGEREASQRLRGKLSHGLALNALAHYDVDAIDERLARQARAIFTAADRAALRKGG